MLTFFSLKVVKLGTNSLLLTLLMFVILFVIIGQEGGYTYNFMGGFGPKGIHAAGGAVFMF